MPQDVSSTGMPNTRAPTGTQMPCEILNKSKSADICFVLPSECCSVSNIITYETAAFSVADRQFQLALVHRDTFRSLKLVEFLWHEHNAGCISIPLRVLQIRSLDGSLGEILKAVVHVRATSGSCAFDEILNEWFFPNDPKSSLGVCAAWGISLPDCLNSTEEDVQFKVSIGVLQFRRHPDAAQRGSYDSKKAPKALFDFNRVSQGGNICCEAFLPQQLGGAVFHNRLWFLPFNGDRGMIVLRHSSGFFKYWKSLKKQPKMFTKEFMRENLSNDVTNDQVVRGEWLLKLLKILHHWMLHAPHICAFQLNVGYATLVSSDVLFAFGMHILDGGYNLRFAALHKFLHWCIRVAVLAFESGYADRCACCGCSFSSCEVLKSCSFCRIARYCSCKCQKDHWPIHKPTCFARGSELGFDPHAQLDMNFMTMSIPPGSLTHTVSCSMWPSLIREARAMSSDAVREAIEKHQHGPHVEVDVDTFYHPSACDSQSVFDLTVEDGSDSVGHEDGTVNDL